MSLANGSIVRGRSMLGLAFAILNVRFPARYQLGILTLLLVMDSSVGEFEPESSVWWEC